MPKLTDERLDEIRQLERSHSSWIGKAHTVTAMHDLLSEVDHLTTELEDTRAAYQLAQRQLDAHRRGQGTWIHQELGGHTETLHDTTEGNTP